MKSFISIIGLLIADVIVNVILKDVDPSIGRTLFLIAFNPVPQLIGIIAYAFFLTKVRFLLILLTSI